jgi:hypothetical protein
MGLLNASTFDVIEGTCLKRIHSTMLRDCLGYQLVRPIQLLAVHTSMVQAIRDPQTDETLPHHLTRVVNVQGTILKAFKKLHPTNQICPCMSCCIIRFSRRVFSLLAATQRCSRTS